MISAKEAYPRWYLSFSSSNLSLNSMGILTVAYSTMRQQYLTHDLIIYGKHMSHTWGKGLLLTHESYMNYDRMEDSQDPRPTHGYRWQLGREWRILLTCWVREGGNTKRLEKKRTDTMNEYECEILKGLLKVSWSEGIKIDISQPELCEDQSFIVRVYVEVSKELGHVEYWPELLPRPTKE